MCCVQCGSHSPGFHCEWQNNYTHCGPCASLVACPVCRENFLEEELLLQCQHCDRWAPRADAVRHVCVCARGLFLWSCVLRRVRVPFVQVGPRGVREPVHGG